MAAIPCTQSPTELPPSSPSSSSYGQYSSPQPTSKTPLHPPSPSNPAGHHKQTSMIRRRQFPGCSGINEYKILHQVGEGTFGEVYRGSDRRTGEMVALKRLRVENEKDGFPITAIREIKLLRHLKHENVIPMREMAVRKTTSGQISEIYMVFPYLDHDLGGLIDTPSFKLEIPLIKNYSAQIFRALEYLHGNRILHRDLKAANLLLDGAGKLLVADFGLARPYCVPLPHGTTNNLSQQQPAPLTGMVVTRWYRPPELLLGSRYYNSAIDIWGAGCIVGEMLRRRALFAGSSDCEQLDCIFRVCGSPTESTWPNWRSVGKSDLVQEYKAPYQRTLVSFLERFFIDASIPIDRLLLSLLDRLLVVCPESRPSAAKVLADPWFIADPLPDDPKRYPAEHCHEYEVRHHRGRNGSMGRQIQRPPIEEKNQSTLRKRQRTQLHPQLQSHLPPQSPISRAQLPYDY